MTDPEPPPGPIEAEEFGHEGLDDRERTLDPRIVGLWQLMTALGLALMLPPLAMFSFVFLGRLGLVVPAVAVVAIVAIVVWHPRARYERWRWRLTPLALELRFGVLIHRHTAVPYFRIQQIDISRGPLERWLGLASLEVTTASASGSAALPGIAADDAPVVRAELLARAAAAAGGAEDGISDAV